MKTAADTFCFRTACCLAWVLLTGNVVATVVIQYDANPGAPDPTTIDGNPADAGVQSWTGGNGSAVNDGGIPAWQTPDTGTGPPTFKLAVPTTFVTDGGTNGWRLSWKVKALRNGMSGYPASQAISLIYLETDLTDIWRLDLGVESDGDQIISVSSRIANGTPTVVGSYTDGGGGEVYNLYELTFDPGTSKASLAVDGIEVLSNLAGPNISSASAGDVQVRWGDGSTSTNPTRIANHNLVQWETVPEPSSFLLLSLTALAMATLRKKVTATKFSESS